MVNAIAAATLPDVKSGSQKQALEQQSEWHSLKMAIRMHGGVRLPAVITN